MRCIFLMGDFMFLKGEKVVYGQTGVCIIEDICEKELIKKQKRLYYVLRPVNQENNVIYAPAESEKVFIRSVITREEAEELISKIPQICEDSEIGDNTKEEYRNCLSTHRCSDLVKLTSQIYNKRKQALENRKKLGFVDEKYMHLAESLLFGELACALEIPVEEVKNYIVNRLKSK